MTRRCLIHRCVGLAFTVAAQSWGGPNNSAPPPALAVIVHRECRTDRLSYAQLRSLLAGNERVWPDSRPVVIVEQPDDSITQKRVLEIVLRTNPERYKRMLLATQFQGKELPLIKVLNTNETAVQFVWNVPGAIAVVDETAATQAGERIKVLRIDGRLPSDLGYPLR